MSQIGRRKVFFKKKTNIENKNSLFPIVSFLWHIFASWWQKRINYSNANAKLVFWQKDFEKRREIYVSTFWLRLKSVAMLLLLFGEIFGPKSKKKEKKAVVTKCSIEVGMHTTYLYFRKLRKKKTHTHTHTNSQQKFLFDNFWALGDQKKIQCASLDNRF